ncbi:lysylphosphatidylglycerol synthase domain-containing protein [Rhodopila sp.]|uniref:lysylphosphatidylglycerol synthase domain-containing protein n=1 Tax=Rhodopila sp. TaxID=2480087 RepID=UPI003D12993E
MLGLALVVWVASATWNGFSAALRQADRALWTLPVLVALHLVQLLFSSMAWRILFTWMARPGLATFYRLRLIREGIDSLLPVAQIGGEVIGARLLAATGIPAAVAGASVIVDLTLELIGQLIFLLAGLAALACLPGRTGWLLWLEVVAGAGLIVTAFMFAQRHGVLTVIEAAVRGLAKRFPALQSTSIEGLHTATISFYNRRGLLPRSALIHAFSWSLGSVETWLVLQAAGAAVTPLQALVVESLGMAARSAGFAVPAALGVQEGGFVLAAAAVGLSPELALALSLIKRVREIIVGLVGLVLWRRATPRVPVTLPAA